jgi:hypothetical protein
VRVFAISLTNGSQSCAIVNAPWQITSGAPLPILIAANEVPSDDVIRRCRVEMFITFSQKTASRSIL